MKIHTLTFSINTVMFRLSDFNAIIITRVGDAGATSGEFVTSLPVGATDSDIAGAHEGLMRSIEARSGAKVSKGDRAASYMMISTFCAQRLAS